MGTITFKSSTSMPKISTLCVIASFMVCNPIFAQNTIRNVKFKVTEEKTVVVEYRLDPTVQAQRYHISLWLSVNNGQDYAQVASVAGDIGLVSGRGKKEIIWNVFDDIDWIRRSSLCHPRR